MGRTNPTFRDVLRSVEGRWAPFRRALRYEDQQRFDRLLGHARTHADAAGNLNHHSPIVPVLLAISLAQERRIDDLGARLDELEGEIGEQADRVDDLEAQIDDFGHQYDEISAENETSPHERTG
ncbi:hypothetical protein [Halorhabdus sp. SVX81]|uniref:hypothetical protein n=1 Tax=Halorhabdus sp. SVX81 TaxID=2978283 RepID=UPI0023DA0B7E|nr:hypothetical protein [Halorhabdus sp. SVX81]